MLERVALVGEDLGQPLGHQCDERIRLLDGPPRLVHEAGLDRIPLDPITGGFLTSKDRYRPFIDRPGLTRLRLGRGGRHGARDVVRVSLLAHDALLT